MAWVLGAAALGGGLLYLGKIQNELTDCQNNNHRLESRVEELKEEIRSLQVQLKQKNQKIQELESKEQKD